VAEGLLTLGDEPRCWANLCEARRGMPPMVVPLANPATQPRASWHATRRDGAHWAQGGVTRNLFGTTKLRSSCLALHPVGRRRGRHQAPTDPRFQL